AGLADLAIDLAGRSASFKASLPEGIAAALAALVRAMNCYYSNLIEGHNTHPIDIERALKGDYSTDKGKRDLQLEARAHMTVQAWIDGGGIAGHPTDVGVLQDIHRRFCELLPPDLLFVEDPVSGERVAVVPGALRHRDVQVGRHRAVSPGAVPRFLARTAEVYGRLGRAEAILAVAAAHHRLLWVHPFLDGNGRVARLVSHAMFLKSVDSGALWSIARGFARNEAAYKGHLAACDLGRRNDLDGRGNLSEEALADFTRFVLTTAIDQVEFMRGLIEPDRLRARILLWAEEEARAGRLVPRAGQVIEAILYRGELPRGEVPAILGLGDRQARRVTQQVLSDGILTAAGPRAPLRLAFPATLAGRWMPGLFPERAD
ncbi:MAG TPA: Fic family protein, partial [Hyphomicrobiaceae bacterium]|nr:Fic family protein [Hyphomicrobiaceae bacterium]